LPTDEEILASVRLGRPPPDSPVLGTWKLESYVRERLSDGHRHNQFGEAPDGYIGYAQESLARFLAAGSDLIVLPRDPMMTCIAREYAAQVLRLLSSLP
jgi:hypothetical protein